jgi:hypothetical protein
VGVKVPRRTSKQNIATAAVSMEPMESWCLCNPFTDSGLV